MLLGHPSPSLIPFCRPVPRWSHSTDCTLWERGDGWTLATNQYPGWALSQWGSWPQSPCVPSSLSPGLQRGGAFFCSSEIPSDLQDTQPSPGAIDLGPASHMLSPPISLLRSLHAGGRRMHILHSLGNYSPTALCMTPGHHPTAPYKRAPGTQLGLSCFKGRAVMKMSCNCIRREDWQRSSGLWQAAPLHPLAQRLPAPQQVVSWPHCCC